MTLDPDEYLQKPFGHLADLINAHAVNVPDRIALDDGEEKLTWAETTAYVNRIAAQLQADGLQKGQAVSILGITTVPLCARLSGSDRGGWMRGAADHFRNAKTACRDDGG